MSKKDKVQAQITWLQVIFVTILNGMKYLSDDSSFPYFSLIRVAYQLTESKNIDSAIIILYHVQSLIDDKNTSVNENFKEALKEVIAYTEIAQKLLR